MAFSAAATFAALALPLASLATESPAPVHLETCISCHGAQGRSSSGDIPHLAGQQLNYLAKQLHAFRSGERKHELMQAVAGQLTPQEIQALARYWSHLPPDGGSAAATPITVPIASGMRFPQGFPAGFTEYDRETDDKTRLITVRYANPAALEAARAGKPLLSGAIVVSGEYSGLFNADGRPELDAQGRWKLGALRSLAGMESRAGWGEQVPRLLRNGDWHYGLWTPEGQSRLQNMHAQCLACHQPRAKQSYVFSWEALRKPPTGQR